MEPIIGYPPKRRPGRPFGAKNLTQKERKLREEVTRLHRNLASCRSRFRKKAELELLLQENERLKTEAKRAEQIVEEIFKELAQLGPRHQRCVALLRRLRSNYKAY